jgi:hypothetical protein
MQMIAEALRPVIAYSLPLGLFTQEDLDTFAGLMTRGVKEACGLMVGTRTGWALLDRTLGGLGAVDIHEIAGACDTYRLVNDLQDGDNLGRMARGMLDALTNPDRFMERKSQGWIDYHQLYQLAGLAGNGLMLEGTLKDIFQEMVVEGTSGDMEVTFGQSFGKSRMERYMPLWFELGIPGPGALVSPVRIGREGGGRELMSVPNFQKEYGTVGKWCRKAGGEDDPGPYLSSKATIPGTL